MLLGIFKNKIKEEKRIDNAASRLYFWIGGQEGSYLEEIIKRGWWKSQSCSYLGEEHYRQNKKKIAASVKTLRYVQLLQQRKEP